MKEKVDVGSLAWTDLTVQNAVEVKDFYAQVIGWNASPVDMGGYSDFNMHTPSSDHRVAGICHARGANSDLPAQWLVYIVVENIDRSRTRCEELGGRLLTPIKDMGSQGRYCVIQDPAGAVAALWEKNP